MPRNDKRQQALLVRLILRRLVEEHEEVGQRWMRNGNSDARVRDRPSSGWFTISDAQHIARQHSTYYWTGTEQQAAMDEAFRQFDVLYPQHVDDVYDMFGDIINRAVDVAIGKEEFRSWAADLIGIFQADPAYDPRHPRWPTHWGAHTLVTGRDDQRTEIGLPRDLRYMQYAPTASELHRWRRDNPAAAAVNDPNDPVAYDQWMWMETSPYGPEYD